MWSVRQMDGQWMVEDDPEAPAPAPVTTIAWRIWHIASSCLSQYISHLGPWPLAVQGREWYPDVGSALTALDQGWQAFDQRIHALGETGVRGSLGPDWGPYADNSWADRVTPALGRRSSESAHDGPPDASLGWVAAVAQPLG